MSKSNDQDLYCIKVAIEPAVQTHQTHALGTSILHHFADVLLATVHEDGHFHGSKLLLEENHRSADASAQSSALPAPWTARTSQNP